VAIGVTDGALGVCPPASLQPAGWHTSLRARHHWKKTRPEGRIQNPSRL